MARLKPLFADDASRECSNAVCRTVRTRDTGCLASVYMADMCVNCPCGHLFIPEVKEHFGKREIAIVDGGAYTGDLLEPIIASGLNVKTWYAFELDKRNYDRMKEHIERVKVPSGMQCVCENMGLWSCKAELPTQGDGTWATLEGAKSGESGRTAQVIDIDTYFKDKHIDLLKLHIEGAEMEVLKGAMQTIKRDRPVIAVWTYHKIKDRWQIMDYLMGELGGGYKWYLRHHTMDLEETVLYRVLE